MQKILADFLAVNHCLLCDSAENAYRAVLKHWEIGPEDVILVPDFCYPELADYIKHTGCHIVFVDVNRDTFIMDSKSLSRELEKIDGEGYRTKVVICVDLFGQAADYYNIKIACRNYKAHLLEDATQACGGGVDISGAGDYKMCGTYGEIGIFCFDSDRRLGCGSTGGAIVTDDEGIAEALENNIGPMDDKAATTLRDSLARFRGETAVRQEVPQGSILLAINQVSEWYDEHLLPLKKMGVITPVLSKGNLSVWYKYNIKLAEGIDRKKVFDKILSKDVKAEICYERTLSDICLGKSECSLSAELCDRVISLPINPYMTEDEVVAIADKLGECI